MQRIRQGLNEVFLILAVHFLYIGGIGIFILGIFIPYFSTLTFALAFAYFVYVFTDKRHEKSGAPWDGLSETMSVWKTGRKYHNMETFLEPTWRDEKSAPSQTVMAFHPHGVVTDFRILFDGIFTEVFPSLKSRRTLAASVVFRIPFLREIALWTYCVSANRKTAEENIAAGHSIILCPGGMDEQLMTERNKEKIFILKRKGFIRLAIKQGCPVTAVYVFGTNDLYWSSLAFYNIRKWIVRHLRFCPMFFIGRYLLVPAPGHLRVVVSEPIPVEKFADPSEEYVDEIHQKYIKELKRIFQKYQEPCGARGRELEIF